MQVIIPIFPIGLKLGRRGERYPAFPSFSSQELPLSVAVENGQLIVRLLLIEWTHLFPGRFISHLQALQLSFFLQKLSQ